MIADTRDEALAGIQSGLRASARIPLVVPGTDETSAHTGYYVFIGKGTTHTEKQSKVHDYLRSPIDPTKTPDQKMVEQAGKALKTFPHGQQILHDPKIKGAVLKRKLPSGDYPEAYGEATDEKPDPARIPEARTFHMERES